MTDLSRRELALLVPIAAVVLWMGVYPESFMAPMRQDVSVLLQRIERSAPTSDAMVTAGRPAPTGHGGDAGHGGQTGHSAETNHGSEAGAH